jgi:hypothetical protein
MSRETHEKSRKEAGIEGKGYEETNGQRNETFIVL